MCSIWYENVIFSSLWAKMSWMSDDESLAGLTQEPSQQHTEVNSDSSYDSFHGFNLIPAEDLVSVSANKESDFSQFVAAIDSDVSVGSDHDEVGNGSQSLFDDTQLNRDKDTATVDNSTSVSVSLTFVCNIFSVMGRIFRHVYR